MGFRLAVKYRARGDQENAIAELPPAGTPARISMKSLAPA